MVQIRAPEDGSGDAQGRVAAVTVASIVGEVILNNSPTHSFIPHTFSDSQSKHFQMHFLLTKKKIP